MKEYRVGVIQLDTTADKEDNLRRIEALVKKAADDGARMVVLPEIMNVTSLDPEIAKPETIPGYSIDRMCKIAKSYDLWIHCGSIREQHMDGEKPCNTSVMVNPNGKIAAIYRKLHLFDVYMEKGPKIMESDMNSKGSEIVTLDTELGKLGFSLCYDMRFPELYRLMALEGCQVLFAPANFTKPTGEMHWHTLLRARAIENGCYVLAPGQCGQKPRFEAYGHSLIIDPWGHILAEKESGEGLIMADIDLTQVTKAREELGSLNNRRTDLYRLERI
mgnify:CR=1 FL=1